MISRWGFGVAAPLVIFLYEYPCKYVHFRKKNRKYTCFAPISAPSGTKSSSTLAYNNADTFVEQFDYK
jgi:hypothetical protein